MLLVVDVGNTNTVLGVFDGSTLVHHWRIETRKSKTSDEYGVLIHELFRLERQDARDIGAAIVSCVVPPLLMTWDHVCQRFFGIKPLVVGPGMRTGMPVLYENPREVGADRIVNSVAAFERFKSAAIVVDFGTATTFDVINAHGAYLGGAIAPGIRISADALFHHASKLPRIDVARPRHVIGKNTVESMQSGILFGYVGLVDGLVQRMRKEIHDSALVVVATGGLAELVGRESVEIDHVLPLLTLEGLRILHERNSPAVGE